MTFRIYVRWPDSQTSDKTSTESRAVAELAFKELTEKAASLKQQGAIGITFTSDKKQVNYLDLTADSNTL